MHIPERQLSPPEPVMSLREQAARERAIDERLAARALDEVERSLPDFVDWICDVDAADLAALVSAVYQRKDDAGAIADRIVREYRDWRAANPDPAEVEQVILEIDEEAVA